MIIVKGAIQTQGEDFFKDLFIYWSLEVYKEAEDEIIIYRWYNATGKWNQLVSWTIHTNNVQCVSQ